MTVRVRPVALASTALMALVACSPKADAPAGAPAAPAASAVAAIPESADVKPFTIGRLQAAALRDGGLSVPNDNKTLAIDKSRKEVADLLTANSLSPETIDLSVQPLLVKTADKVLLFDTRRGGHVRPDDGQAAGDDGKRRDRPGKRHGHLHQPWPRRPCRRPREGRQDTRLPERDDPHVRQRACLAQGHGRVRPRWSVRSRPRSSSFSRTPS